MSTERNGAGLKLSAETGGLLFGFYTSKQCFEKGYFECKSRVPGSKKNVLVRACWSVFILSADLGR